MIGWIDESIFLFIINLYYTSPSLYIQVPMFHNGFIILLNVKLCFTGFKIKPIYTSKEFGLRIFYISEVEIISMRVITKITTAATPTKLEHYLQSFSFRDGLYKHTNVLSSIQFEEFQIPFYTFVKDLWRDKTSCLFDYFHNMLLFYEFTSVPFQFIFIDGIYGGTFFLFVYSGFVRVDIPNLFTLENWECKKWNGLKDILLCYYIRRMYQAMREYNRICQKSTKPFVLDITTRTHLTEYNISNRRVGYTFRTKFIQEFITYLCCNPLPSM